MSTTESKPVPYDRYAEIYTQALKDYIAVAPLKFYTDKYEQHIYNLGRFLGRPKKL
jgi:hypothetical protein